MSTVKHPFFRILPLAALLVLALAAPALGANWNHDPDSPIGPNYWGVIGAPDYPVCGTGKAQSPINIERDKVRCSVPLIQNLNFNYADTPFEVETFPHYVELPYAAGSNLVVGGKSYQLAQFHFHAPSEHQIDGVNAAMEVHLVHRDAAGNIAVVGILMNVGPNPNPLADMLFQYAPMEEGKVSPGEGWVANARALLVPFGVTAFPSLASIFPGNNYYTYPGSLTTPPCSEGVRWFVLKEVVTVSAKSVEKFHAIIGNFPYYGGYENNNRPTQPLNGRKVLGTPGF